MLTERYLLFWEADFPKLMAPGTMLSSLLCFSLPFNFNLILWFMGRDLNLHPKMALVSRQSSCLTFPYLGLQTDASVIGTHHQ